MSLEKKKECQVTKERIPKERRTPSFRKVNSKRKKGIPTDRRAIFSTEQSPYYNTRARKFSVVTTTEIVGRSQPSRKAMKSRVACGVDRKRVSRVANLK